MMRVAELKMKDRILIPRCFVAETFFRRFLGLMGKKNIREDEALLFPRCNSIHTFFMRFSIDVIMVGNDGTVIEVIEGMVPWRILLPRRAAKHVIEMKTAHCKSLGICTGSKLSFPGVWE